MRKTAFLGVLVAVIFVYLPLAMASEVGSGISADVGINMLKAGNDRFVQGKPSHPNEGADRRKLTTVKGQTPFASLLSCSDSRVPVEAIFDQGIGDLFVVRVAGNVANVDETASLEYGADHLGTPLLLVLGHTHCGAVTAVVQGAEVHGNISTLVKSIVPAVAQAKKNNPGVSGDTLINAAIDANVWQAIEDLFKSSPIISNRVRTGKLKVIGALYDIDSGKVTWMGPHPKQDQFLSASKTNH
jgi:carbonic anhydrase